MAAEVEIREYRPADAGALLDLMRALQRSQRDLFADMLPPELIGPWYREAVLADCASTNGRVLIAERHGRAVGYATVLIDVVNDERDEQPYRYASLDELFVAPDHRGCGLGTRLIGECERLARTSGATRLRIKVLGHNRHARRLYRRAGFDEHLIELEKRLAAGD